jgi:ferrochelatase
VLLMAHGTPSSLDEMPEYLRLVRGGRPPSDELVAEMRENYAAIGGRSPLTEITEAQAAALRARLGPEIPVAVGMRNWRPFIKEAIAELAAAGVTRVIGIPMAPQFSTLSVQKYIEAASAALPGGIRLDPVESFHLHPLLLDAFTDRVRAAQPRPGELVVFTAHSLPVRVIEAGDRYADQVAETARGVAERAGIAKYDLAFQSAGRSR